MKTIIPKFALSLLLLTNTFITSFVLSIPIANTQTVIPEKEIRNKIKAVTVQINGRTDQGTGVIIDKQGNDYLVLTNWHVVKNDPQYQLITDDNQIHTSTRIVELVGADLAIVAFSSGENYPVATKGDSQTLTAGDTIHYGGYPGSSTVQTQRTYYPYRNETLRTILSPSDVERGYQFVISGEALPGLSGTGVFNDQGQLIAIYGETRINSITGQNNILAIPINTAVNLADRQQNIAISNWQIIFASNPPANKNTNQTSNGNIDNISTFSNETNNNNPINVDSQSTLQPKTTIGSEGEEIVALSNPNYKNDGIITGTSGSKAIISPDQKKLITYGSSSSIKVWDMKTGKLLRTLNSHSNDVNSVAISSDNKTIVSASRDSDIRVWRLDKILK